MSTKKLQILGSLGSDVEIDATLTEKGNAADAKAVGDALALKANQSSFDTLSRLVGDTSVSEQILAVTPTKLSQLENDSNYITSYTETDPTVPAWAKASTKPTYTADEVGADASGTASSVVSTHDTSTTAHTDIRSQISQLSSEKVDEETLQRLYCSTVPYGTEIAADSDLNTTDFLKVGNYYCSKNADVTTLTNCPTSLAFMMQVYSPLSTTIDNETTKTWVYRLRKLISHKGDEYYQFVNSGSTAGTFTYGEWIKIAKISDIPTDDHINALIDTKLNAITNAEEVSF